MVKAEGIEICRHAGQAVAPPSASVGHHYLPVERGEGPVLPVGPFGVGHGPGLRVEVEQPGMHPCLDAVARHAYWYVAHQEHTVGPRIVGCGLQLAVEQILYEENIPGFAAPFGTETVDGLLVVFTKPGPPAAVGRRIGLTEQAISSIVGQPMVVGIHKLTISVGTGYHAAKLVVVHAKKRRLDAPHCLVVALAHGIELHALLVKRDHGRPVRQIAQGIDVNIFRIERIYRHYVVGANGHLARESPRIVYGQRAYSLHARCHGPVYQQLQVAKVAYAVRVGTAQREYGNSHAGHPPHRLAHPEQSAVAHGYLPVGTLAAVQCPVVAFFPSHEIAGLFVDNHKLVFELPVYSNGVYGQHPHRLSRILHLEIARCAPIAKHGVAAAQGHGLAFRQLWGRHRKQYGLAEQCHVERHKPLAHASMHSGKICACV